MRSVISPNSIILLDGSQQHKSGAAVHQGCGLGNRTRTSTMGDTATAEIPLVTGCSQGKSGDSAMEATARPSMTSKVSACLS